MFRINSGDRANKRRLVERGPSPVENGRFQQDGMVAEKREQDQIVEGFLVFRLVWLRTSGDNGKWLKI